MRVPRVTRPHGRADDVAKAAGREAVTWMSEAAAGICLLKCFCLCFCFVLNEFQIIDFDIFW